MQRVSKVDRYFAERQMLRERIERLELKVTDLEKGIEAERAAHLNTDEARRGLLKKLLDVNFEARVAKGCYTRCPVGRIAARETNESSGSQHEQRDQ